MRAYLVEKQSDAVCRRLFFLQRRQLHDLRLQPQPHLLSLVQVHFPRLLLLQLLESRQRQADEGVEDDQVPEEEEDHEEDLDVLVGVVGGSHVFAVEVHHVLHEVNPTLHRPDEEQTQQRREHVSEVDFVFDPISSPVETILFGDDGCPFIGVIAVVAVILVDFGEDESEEEVDDKSDHEQLTEFHNQLF